MSISSVQSTVDITQDVMDEAREAENTLLSSERFWTEEDRVLAHRTLYEGDTLTLGPAERNYLRQSVALPLQPMDSGL